MDDFDAYYMKQVALLSEGYIPYSQIPLSSTPFSVYALFLLVLAGGRSLAALLPVLADASCPAIIYVIVKRRAGDGPAAVAAMGYALSPIALFFEGFIWFDSQPTVLLVLLSLLFAERGRARSSAATLGIAVLFKQDALFLLPALLLWEVLSRKRGALKYFETSLATIFLGSLPFLLTIPIPYLVEVSYGLFPNFGWSGPTQSLAGPSASLASSIQVATCNYTLNLSYLVESCLNNGTFTSWIRPQGLSNIVGLFGIYVGPFAISGLALLTVPILYLSREWENSKYLLASYASAAFLVAFSLLFHFAYRYYLLLPYSLLSVGSVNSKTAIVPGVAMVASVFLPEGNLQLLLFQVAMISFVAIEDGSIQRVRQRDTAVGDIATTLVGEGVSGGT